MSKEVIAVDVDDVLAAERDGVREYINKEFNQTFTSEDYTIEGKYWGYWEEVWRQKPDTAKAWYEQYLNSGVHAEHEVLPDAITVLSQLQENYDFAVVTSRHDMLIDLTCEWLTKHFPGTFKHVEFVKLWNKNRELTKADICNEIGATYLIDDNAEHCNLAAEAGIQALLFGDYGWNKKPEFLQPTVIRVIGWNAVKDFFDAKSR